MIDETYNGWTNRETWAAALWINNDQGMQEFAYEIVRTDPYGDGIKDWIEELQAEATEGGIEQREVRLMLNDIGSLWRVNWSEIRDSLIEDQAG